MIGLRNSSQDAQGFMDYFSCEAGGENPEDHCIFEVDRQYQQVSSIVSYIITYASGPYVILVYAMPTDMVKEKWRKGNNRTVQTNTQ